MAILVIAVLALSAVPMGSADYTTKTELDRPDEIHHGFESSSADEDKEENKSRSSPPPSLSAERVNTTLVRKGSSSRESSSVTFPYEKFGWRISKCYRTDDGLRLYGVYFEDEKILYDYRVPWVMVGNNRRALTTSNSDGPPDLYIWETLEAFKVEVSYTLSLDDVEVKVYSYFYHDGSFDPWVIVDCDGDKKNIQVGQRFDFDLDGAGDDNAKYHTSLGWDLVDVEDDFPDDGEPEDHGVQWLLMDTDVVEQVDVEDQLVEIIPYGIDSSVLYVLRYHNNELSGHPSSYDNNEDTGEYLYGGSTYEYQGYDLVAWYVSAYEDTVWCNPGPWTEVEV
jgi:hypothetical protein